jgi:hypothetical protein
MNDIDPQAWLADVLARLPSQPMSRIDDLLPWNWKASRSEARAGDIDHGQGNADRAHQGCSG